MSDLVVLLEETSPLYANFDECSLLWAMLTDKFILGSLKSFIYLMVSGRMVHVQYGKTSKKPVVADPVLILRKEVAEVLQATFPDSLEFFVPASVLPFLPSLMATVRPFPDHLLSPSEVARATQGKRMEPVLIQFIRQTSQWSKEPIEPMKGTKRNKSSSAASAFDPAKGMPNGFATDANPSQKPMVFMQ